MCYLGRYVIFVWRTSQNTWLLRMIKLPFYSLLSFVCLSFILSPKAEEHTEYYKNALLTKGMLQDGERSGEWRFFYPNEQLHMVGHFKTGHKHGEWLFYNEKGVVMSKAHFNQDTLHGQMLLYTAKGEQKATLQFREGQFTGNASWFLDGKLSHTITQLTGGRKIVSYFPSGQKHSICKEWKGKQTDTAKLFYPNGELKEVLVFYHNMLLNVSESKAPSGINLPHGNLQDGDGLLIRYNDQGGIRSKVFYKSGLKNGIAQFYHENGELAEAGLYDAGRKTGMWKYYTTKGDLANEVEFRKNENDIEFDLDFGYSDSIPFAFNHTASFPAGTWRFNRFLKEELAQYNIENGTEVWLTLDIDELGFPQKAEISTVIDGTKQRTQLDVAHFPRCIPAFKNGITRESQIIHVLNL